jgi:hypothetical protein
VIVVSNEASHVEQHTKSSDHFAPNQPAPPLNCNAAIWNAAVLPPL